jgi:hypothetical protein
MKLLTLLGKALNKVVIQGIELNFKKLNWKELSEFQAFSSEVEKKDGEEINTTVAVCAYILENYVTDKSGSVIASKDEVELLPVDFCVELVEEFISSLSNSKNSDELKKK